MTIQIAQRMSLLKPSATLAVASKAKALKSRGIDVIDLSVGEPDFPTPSIIKQAGIEAIQHNQSHYTAVDGTPELKQAIIHKLKRDNQLSYEPSQILVSSGAKHSIFNMFFALLNPGDEVVIPAPYWVSYPEVVTFAEAVPVIVPTTLKNHFKITPEQLEKSMTPRTRLLILNSPSNPTGSVYSKAELTALGDVLLRHPHVIIMTDDIYEHITWHGEPCANIVNTCPDLYDRTIVINGVSKAYAMTGWRIGFAAGSAELIAAMKKIQSQSTSNPCSIAQAASVAAFQSDLSIIKPMQDAFKERHDYFYHALSMLNGCDVCPGQGAFYLFPDVTAWIQQLGLKDDLEFSEYILEKAHIAAVPGSAFGAPNHIRFSYATSQEKLEMAVERLKQLVGE